MRAEAARAIALAGGGVQATYDWNEVAATVSRLGSTPLLLAETEGVAPHVLAQALPKITADVAFSECHAIVSLDESMIDLVTRSLMGDNVQLLCTPNFAERVAAIAMGASYTATRPNPVVRETPSARRTQLAEEVARIAKLLADLAAQEPPPRNRDDELADRRTSFGVEPSRTTSAETFRRVIRGRRLRDNYFGKGLFEDPAWDMILDLAAAAEEGIEVTISSLCIAAAVAPTTALRWITRLVGAGLFVRRPDPSDGRRAIVELTPSARAAVHAFFAAADDMGLSAIDN